MEKVIKSREEFFVEFTDEELSSLKLKKGDKLSVEIDEKTNKIKLTPYERIDIDLSEFKREILEFFIQESVQKDISVNEVITQMLSKALDLYKDDEQ
jgi:hypothetical protein